MVGVRRSVALAVGALALMAAGSAAAQENLDSGKSAAQLFASDCAICHKTTQGLTRSSGLFGLQSFLREHYTASKESAAAIAAYVEATDKGAPAAKRGAPGKRTAKGDDKTKKDGKKIEKTPDVGKTSDAKPAEKKTGDDKPVETKTEKPAGTKSGDKKPD